MFCSTIIPTIGRPSLANAVNSVLNQDFHHADYEVIVVNDSATPLPEAEWQNSHRVTILNTKQHNRSVARNTGAAIARGRYLHFLDDDDWLLPDVFNSFWETSNSVEAAWIYGAYRLVDNSGVLVTEINPDESGNCLIQLMAWEWLPLQASFINADAFFRVGGFASLQSLDGGFEDIDLSRQISLYYEMARIDKIVASIRIGEVSSTTNYVGMFTQNRQSREKTLCTQGASTRLIASAKSSRDRSSYWTGKVIYFYLASMKWNLKRRRISTSASRFTTSILGFSQSGRYIFSKNFWRGVIKPHIPRMGIALQEAGASYLYSDTKRQIEIAQGWSKR